MHRSSGARRLPLALVALRAVAAPTLVVGAALGAPGGWLATLVTLAFLSDIFDGVVARRVGVATDSLRFADSVVDLAFYAGATVAVFIRAPATLVELRWPLAAVGALELARLVLELAKFGRMAAYHMWSAKLWGIALWLGFSEVFLQARAGPFFRLAVGLGILADLEGLIASMLLRTRQRDVRTLWHALAREAAQ
jgi:CDP-diacylglycerol--glycerol-3-phosphate 3-phosphatidyltransferase